MLRTAAPRALGLCLVLSVVAAASCSDEEANVTTGVGGGAGAASTDGGGGVAARGGATSLPVLPAANAVGPGDPTFTGQARFFWDAWGTEVLDEWPPTDFMLGLMQSEPEVFGNQFAAFGFLPDPNDDLPVGFKRGLVDPTKVHETCALCHVGKLADGTLWLGAPNLELDFGRFGVEVDKRWVAAGHPSRLTELEKSKALALGPGRTNAESSDYPFVVPADFPMYFNLGQRTHMNYLGTGANVRTEVYFSIYTFGAGSPNDDTAIVKFPKESRVDDFATFLGSLAPPPAPPEDPALVAAGRAAFDKAACGSCHHVDALPKDDIVPLDAMGTERAATDPKFPRGSIATDPEHWNLDFGPAGGAGGSSGGDAGFGDLIGFIFAHSLTVGESDGYRALDLHGVWLSPPYLHNGSVPTLDDLLRPAAERPTTFMRGSFTVDTTQRANGNGGHEFGVDLSADEKTALVAYLKSL